MSVDSMKEKCNEVSLIMKALSHPQRLMIMCHLAQGEKNVSELLELCNVSQSQISQFLKRMEREKLLKLRKIGNFVFYSIKDQDTLKLVQSMHRIFCD